MREGIDSSGQRVQPCDSTVACFVSGATRGTAVPLRAGQSFHLAASQRPSKPGLKTQDRAGMTGHARQ